MLTAIIVDDEPFASEALNSLLKRYFPEVEVLAICRSGSDALQEIPLRNPDLVFLDIEMPHMNGFDLIEKLPSIQFDLIFTTSHDQYAIQAIRFSALDYLLKPVDREDLKKAIHRVQTKKQYPLPQQLEILLQKLNKPANANLKIAIPTMEGLEMIEIDSVINCESESNYTIFRLKNKQRITASRTLKDIEEILEGHSFVRVHKSFLVNLNEIKRYVKGEGGYLVMSDGTHIDVSRTRKEILLQRLLPNRS
jgi:two-component system, LytTR family, response regulator